MKNKCNCYHIEKTTRYTYHPLTGCPIAHVIDVGVCWGTKERDACDCGGDPVKCDFYPQVRKNARAENKRAARSLKSKEKHGGVKQ